MSHGAQHHRPEDLFDDVAWLRRLAGALVVDPNEADDLAQGAWLAALAQRGEAMAPRSWLTEVVRNLARRRRRGALRGREREQGAARAEASEPTAELCARAALHRELVDRVMALEEPFRTSVLMRYLDNLPPREIARRLDVPVRTVGSRLRRGMERLRAELDQRSGGREAWLPGAVGLASVEAGRKGSIIGAAIMGAKVKAALAAVLVAGGALLALRVLETADFPLQAPQGGASTLADGESPPSKLEVASEVRERVPLGAGASAAGAPVSAEVASGRLLVSGHVLDGACEELGLAEAPAPDAQLRLWVGKEPLSKPPPSPGLEGVCTAGAFELEIEDPGTRPLFLLVEAKAGTDHRRGLASASLAAGASAARGLVLVRPPYGVLHGVVRDGAGTPLPGALVRAPRLKPAMPGVEVLSDDQGEFSLFAEGGVGSPQASLAGWMTLSQGLASARPEGGYEPVEIVLVPAGHLVVHVADTGGRPLQRSLAVSLELEESLGPEAMLRFDPVRTLDSDASGTADFPNLWTGRKVVLMVDDGWAYDKVAETRLQRTSDEAGAALIIPASGSLEVDLVLAQEFFVRGTVASADGLPLPEPVVQIATSAYDVPGPSRMLFDGKGTPDGRFEARFAGDLVEGRLWVIATDGTLRGDEFGNGKYARAATRVLDAEDAHPLGSGERGFELDLRVAPALTIAGRIVDEQGRPYAASACELWAVPAGSGRSDAPTALGRRAAAIAADGAFRFDRLADGLHDVYALRNSPPAPAPGLAKSGFVNGMACITNVPAGSSGLEVVLPRHGGVRVLLDTVSSGPAPDSLTILVGWLEPADGRSAPAPAATPETIEGSSLAAWPKCTLSYPSGYSGPEGAYRFGQFETRELQGNDLGDLGEGWYVFAVIPRVGGKISHVPVGTQPVYLRPGPHVVRMSLTAAGVLAGRVLAEGSVAHLCVEFVDDAGRALALGHGLETMGWVHSLNAAGEFRFSVAPIGKRTLHIGTRAQLDRGEFLRAVEVEVPPPGTDEKPIQIRL